ncbi:MAG: amino acid permease [Planctomycetota bacterium]|nr:amino acid permease [Planctomycetota bacterium]
MSDRDSTTPIENPQSLGSAGAPGELGAGQLRRALGPGIAIAMVVGNVIGSGIFFKPPQIAVASGNFPLIISVWVFGGVLCILGGMCFAELAAMMPRAGGLYVYLKEAYGKCTAFLYGWTDFVFARPASIGALCTASLTMIAAASGWAPNTLERILFITLLISVMAGLNIVGVLWGGSVQLLTTILKAGFLLAIIVVPLILLAGGYGSVDVANYSTTSAPEHDSYIRQFAVVLLAVMWAYNGWHGVTPVAEEIKHPQRNIPLALFAGIGILIVLYVGVNLVYHGVMSMDEIRAKAELADGERDLVGAVAERLLSPFGESWVNGVTVVVTSLIVISMLGAVNSNVMNGPRAAFAMGRDGVFFRSLGAVHASFATPAVAILVQSVMAVVLVVASSAYLSLTKSDNPGAVFELLTNFVVFASSLFYMLAVASVMVLRAKLPNVERPYRTSGYPFVPIAYLVVYAMFLSYVFLDKPLDSGIGLCLVVIGLPFYWCFQRKKAVI